MVSLHDCVAGIQCQLWLLTSVDKEQLFLVCSLITGVQIEEDVS